MVFLPHWPGSCRRVLSAAAAAKSRSAVERFQPRYRRALGWVLHLAAHWISLLSGAFLPFTGELLRVSDYKVHPSSLLAVVRSEVQTYGAGDLYTVVRLQQIQGAKKWACGQSWTQAN